MSFLVSIEVRFAAVIFFIGICRRDYNVINFTLDSLKENGSIDVGLNVRDGDSPGAVGVFLPGGTSIRQTLTGVPLEGLAVPRGESSPPLSQVTLTV